MTFTPSNEGLCEAELASWAASLQRWTQAALAQGGMQAWRVEQWHDITREASELGLWPGAGAAPRGAGADPVGLRRVAELSAGLAWGLHRMGLGRWLADQWGVSRLDAAVPVYDGTGCWGLAPEALAPWWCGRPLDATQRELLKSWAAVPVQEWVTLLPSHWSHLLRASVCMSDVGEIRWQWVMLPRERADVRCVGDGLGLAPLKAWSVSADASDWQPVESPAWYSDELWRMAFLADQRMAMVVAGASVLSAEQAASVHVATRWQGGALLHEHAAVQCRQGRMLAAIQGIDQLLQAWAIPLEDADLSALLLDRLSVHDRCLSLSDDALQLVGAAGYLRHSPTARVWRDQRSLRQLAGGVMDVHRLAALCAAIECRGEHERG